MSEMTFLTSVGSDGCEIAHRLISCFATDMQTNARMAGVFRACEAVGQAVSYGIMSKKNISPLVGFIVNAALLALMLIPTLIVVSMTDNNESKRAPQDDPVELGNDNAKTASEPSCPNEKA